MFTILKYQDAAGLLGLPIEGGQGLGIMTERRTARRYDLSLPVVVRVPTKHSIEKQEGSTRDISTRGLYFVIDQDVQTGPELHITLTLPPEITNGSEVSVRAMARVVRVEHRIEDHSPRLGVAAMIERYDIIRADVAKA